MSRRPAAARDSSAGNHDRLVVLKKEAESSHWYREGSASFYAEDQQREMTVREYSHLLRVNFGMHIICGVSQPRAGDIPRRPL